MPRAGLIRRANSKMCEDMDVVEMKHLHRFRKHPSSFNVMWQPPVHLALVDQFRFEERGPMCVSTKKENTTRDLVRVLRFSRTLAMERHRGVCKTWGAFISVAHITESSSRRKSLQTTKMYRGKIIWKRRYVVFELNIFTFSCLYHATQNTRMLLENQCSSADSIKI